MDLTQESDILPELDTLFATERWDELWTLLAPKIFVTTEPGFDDYRHLISYQVLAKVAYILITQDTSKLIIPQNITIACLKCLGNSCYQGYKFKEYPTENPEDYKLYRILYNAISTNNESPEKSQSYPHETHFPYEGVAQWASAYVVSCNPNKQLPENQLEILRLSIQFLCNLFTFACKDCEHPNEFKLPKCLYNSDLKDAVMNYMRCAPLALVEVSSIFVHNALKELPEDYFTTEEKSKLFPLLMKPMKEGFASAKQALFILLTTTTVLRHNFEELPIEDKLYVLEVIYSEMSGSTNQLDICEIRKIINNDSIEFLCERFCRKSDLILQTVDTYVDGMEPTEIVILLDILGVVTSGNVGQYDCITNNKSLLINCTYLLKAIQMLGKESNNAFTPLQKVSDVAPAAQGITISEASKTQSEDSEMQNDTQMQGSSSRDPFSHPAFGLKAGLIRVIGNMSHQNRICQDAFREMDGIPLLLDCCNIDARNPLIMQWTILALRNLCEGNQENQKIIQNCTKVGVVESSVLKEMGLTLHEEEDGKKIGIVPLSRNE